MWSLPAGIFTILAIFGHTVGFVDEEPSTWWEDDFEDWFQTLLEHQEYAGGTVGVMKNGRLLFARGYGDLLGRKLNANSLMHISSLSKTITAAGIMKLVEEGNLDLQQRVFGDDGILRMIRSSKLKDQRIKDITVEHLLRHSAGWDAGRPPLFDPMFNELYLYRNNSDVVDIAKETGIKGWLTQYDIIRYMIDQPLDYTPGTKSKISNFGYCVLGRVIEQVAGMPYEEFIKHSILSPSGMVHTRVGPRHIEEYRLSSIIDNDEEGIPQTDSQYLHSIIKPQLLDSTLGWYSNIYDLSRFLNCIFGVSKSCRIISQKSVDYLLSRPTVAGGIHGHSWRAIGFHKTTTGAIWQDSEIHDNDVILYHQGPVKDAGFFSQQFSTLPDGFFPKGNENITIIALMASNRYKKLRTNVQRFVSMVQDWPESMPDVITHDLGDVHLTGKGHDMLIKYKLNEHHVVTYSNALKIAGYTMVWIHAYTSMGSTYFFALAQKAENPEELEYFVETGSSTKKLYMHGSKMESNGYRVALAQSYKSMSHDSLASHIILLRKSNTEKNRNFVQWALNQEIDSYLLDLEEATERGFSVAAQSIEHHGKKAFVSYVFRQLPEEESSYVSYHEITLEQLEWMVKSHAMEHYHLEYLDSYKMNGKARFSAVFRRTLVSKWLLQTDIKEEDLRQQNLAWHNMGYIPKIACGYENHNKLRFVGLWVKA